MPRTPVFAPPGHVWTPVFARGKILIYVLDKEAAKEDPALPEKLTDSKNLAKFVRNVLPGTGAFRDRLGETSDLG